ncbi:hypothetical protein [Lacticaseibacillus sharpeae]|nr:hypothetical protein [Lacticaseibacillus sharpeae]
MNNREIAKFMRARTLKDRAEQKAIENANDPLAITNLLYEQNLNVEDMSEAASHIPLEDMCDWYDWEVYRLERKAMVTA